MNALTAAQKIAFSHWVGSTIATGDTLGTGEDVVVILEEMYEIYNLKEQVAHCVLNDFVPDHTWYAVFNILDSVPEGNLDL